MMQKTSFESKKYLGICSYCKKPGHSIHKCYRIHEFPADFKFTREKRFQGGAQANKASFSNEENEQGSASGVQNLTKENVAELLQLLQQVKVGHSSAETSDVATNVSYAGMTNLCEDLACLIQINDESWILDSGTIEHMSFNKVFFIDLKTLAKPLIVKLPNSYSVQVTHSGTISLLPNLILRNVLYIPSFKYNLLSVHKLCRQLKQYVLFTPFSCFLLQGPSVKSPPEIGKEEGGLYILRSRHITPVSKSSPKFRSVFIPRRNSVSNLSLHSCFSFSDSIVKEKLWHYRLGHMPFSNMKNVSSVSITKCSKFSTTYVICPMARQSKLSFPSSSISTKKVFELIHVDTWGPYNSATYDGFKYFLTIVDDFSRGTWTYLLTNKSNAFTILRGFISMVERQFNNKVKIIRSDNAFELGSGKIQSEFFESLGYPHGKKGYKVLNLKNLKPFISRDVVFHEEFFPFASIKSNSSSEISLPTAPVSASHQTPEPLPFPIRPHTKASKEASASSSDFCSSPICSNHPSSPIHSISPSSFSPYSPVTSNQPHTFAPVFPSLDSDSTMNVLIRKSTRPHTTPSYLKDFICNALQLTDVSNSCFLTPVKPTYISFSGLSSTNQHMLNTLSNIQEPTDYL
ncbi:uncharacterized protein LOC142174459 [Nicotiana tabacum]|uniref:Uncharacterized protein LOC142174459 n=1 Tax=Nicotiana tabacum TaxID=4097 RepID=A0AC58TGK5_TOBAC